MRPIIITLLTVLLSTAASAASVNESLKKFAPLMGNWQGSSEAVSGFEGMIEGGIVEWESRWRWLSNRTAVENTWKATFKESGGNHSTGTQVYYMDARTHHLVTVGFGVDGKDTQWSNTGTIELFKGGIVTKLSEKTLNGTESTYTVKNTKISPQKLQSDLYDMVVAGKAMDIKHRHVLERKSKKRNQASNLIPSECPWEWMLGDWTVERSDGTSARINWTKPRKDADFLYGTWVDPDGGVQNELISWQSDRGHLVANAHGPKGSFVAVDFSHVERHRMSGTISKRDMEGNITNGVVMIERISPNESRSRVITADGNAFTEVFRAVEK